MFSFGNIILRILEDTDQKMTEPFDCAIPRGSTVLVTGANGYIASHIINVLLGLGYSVRGTVRTPMPWLSTFFAHQWGPDRCEIVLVPDFQKPGAFAESIKGVSGVIHVVSYHDALLPLLI